MSQKTISARKLAANQANAKKSTGPRSEAGKKRSSQNSFKHGLYAAETVVSTEDPEVYYKFSLEWYRCYSPRDFEELSILSDMISTRWHFLRQCGIDTKIWQDKLDVQARLRAQGNQLQPDPADPLACMAYAFYPSPSIMESNRQMKSFMRLWLGLLDRLKKLHQRPDSEIVAPLPEELKQPPPPPSVTRRPPDRSAPPAPPKNPKTNPPAPEPPAAAKGEDQTNKPHPNDPPSQE
jgi:hypothetical protein